MNANMTKPLIEGRGGVKILVVDDEKLIRMTMSARLSRAGYEPVAVGDVNEAVTVLKENPSAFSAIITDIMMGDMDGFVFRDIVRGIDKAMPVFFLTALDPEEGSGFLKKILADPISFYLPKAVDTEVLIRRIRQIVASRRVQRFIDLKMEEDRKSMELAAHVQRSMLPIRMVRTRLGFYTTFWRPKDIVSGDLYEAIRFGNGTCLYVLGDIQGHGTSAALAMTAVQSFLKHLASVDSETDLTPSSIANGMHRFFRASLADVSYMTALICMHDAMKGEVRWLSCGVDDPLVLDEGKSLPVNPEKRGGMPIGLMPDTVYTTNDEVITPLSPTAVVMAFTDGVLDISRDTEGLEQLPADTVEGICALLSEEARAKGALFPLPHKVIALCAERGYTAFHDDVTALVFGNSRDIDGIYQAAVPLNPERIDRAAQDIGRWATERGLSEDFSGRLQLVLEEKLMNIHDHGFDERDRLREAVGLRLQIFEKEARLTVWDYGTPEPSITVAAGDSSTAFELVNREMGGRGRGRLMLRELCTGVERNRYGILNETVYHMGLEAARD